MFKKLFVLPLVLFSLCGCVEKAVVTPVLDNISFTAEMDYGDTEFTADVTLAQDALNLVVTKPQEIKDLTLNFSKNGVTAEFKGVTYTPDINSLPQGATAQVLFDVMNDITSSQHTLTDDENCKIVGKVFSYEYILVFSPSGLPISLEIEDLDLYTKFSNVTIKQ